MKYSLLAAMAATLVFSSPAEAGLDGSTITASYNFPTLDDIYNDFSVSPASFQVGSGSEAVLNIEDVTWLTIDFTDTGLSILINTVLSGPTWLSPSFNGPVFIGTGINSLLSATVLDTTNYGGIGVFGIDRVLLDGNRLALNFGGISYADGQRLDISFTERRVESPIPEPASWAMFIAGFGVAGTALRRRRSTRLVLAANP